MTHDQGERPFEGNHPLLTTGWRPTAPEIMRLTDGLLFALQVGVAAWVVAELMAGSLPSSWLLNSLLALLAILVVRGGLLEASMGRLQWAVYAQGLALRRHLLRHVVGMPLSVTTTLSPGRLVQALAEDVLWLEHHGAGNRPELAFNAGALAALLLFSVLAWPVAGLAAAGFMGFGFLVLWRVQQRLATGLERRARSLERVALAMIEYAEGMPVMRAFGRAHGAIPGFEADVERLRRGARRGVLAITPIAVLFRALTDLAIAFGIAVAVGCLSLQVTLPPADLGRFAASCLLMAAAAIPARHFAAMLAMLTLARLARDNIGGILAHPALPPGPVAQPPERYDLVFDNVGFTYPGQAAPALRGVSFTARQGELTALVGHNGSGKSTCLQLLMRFQDVASGSVSIGGTDVRAYGTDTLAAMMAPVFQDPRLLHDTLLDNLRIGRPSASTAQVVAAARAAAVHEAILARPEGYQSVVSPLGRNISGGERQRLALARAIVKDAPIVLLDEATSALDAGNEATVQSAIRALVRHKTVLVVAHRLATIQSADRIVVLERGSVVASGTHAELLLSSPHYQRLWQRFEATQDWQLGEASHEP